MLSVRILHEAPGSNWRDDVADLGALAPCDFRVTLVSCDADIDVDRALGDEEPDLFVVACVQRIAAVRRALVESGWGTRLVALWTHAWPQQIECLADVLVHADFAIFTSCEYWRNIGRPGGTAHLPFGVALHTYRNAVPFAQRPRRILWFGPRDKHPGGEFEQVVYPLKQRLSMQGFNCDFRRADRDAVPRGPDELSAWLNSAQAFLCTQGSGGANDLALAAAACGTTLISAATVDMGAIVRHGENGVLVEGRHADAYFDAIAGTEENWGTLAERQSADIRALDRTAAGERFFEAFRALIGGGDRVAEAGRKALNGARHPLGHMAAACADERIDLSDRLTVFVSSVGAATFPACLHLLERQDCRFRLQIIENVAPMNAAFQVMLDACRTEFYLQVDEDMLLYPHAVRTLFERMQDMPADAAIYCEHLYDAHLGRIIMGVKIFRHAVAKRYPFLDVEAFELDQIGRFERDGFKCCVKRLDDEAGTPAESVLGLHGTNLTAQAAYVRYYALQLRRRRDLTRRVARLLDVLAANFRSAPTERNFFALAGALAAQAAPLETAPLARNHQAYAATPGFVELSRLYEHLKRNEI